MTTHQCSLVAVTDQDGNEYRVGQGYHMVLYAGGKRVKEVRPKISHLLMRRGAAEKDTVEVFFDDGFRFTIAVGSYIYEGDGQ